MWTRCIWKYTPSDYPFNLGKNASGSCLIQTHLPEEGAEEEKQLTHHAVVNILTFIRRWREILIQPCFTDSVPLDNADTSAYDRISGVRRRIPVKLNTITINGFNIENFDLLRFPTDSVITGSRLWRGSFQITTNEIDGKTTRPFFRDSVHLAPNLPGNRPCRYASP